MGTILSTGENLKKKRQETRKETDRKKEDREMNGNTEGKNEKQKRKKKRVNRNGSKEGRFLLVITGICEPTTMCCRQKVTDGVILKRQILLQRGLQTDTTEEWQ
jgi:hypothetical protein